MSEYKLERWEPIVNIPSQLYLEELTDGYKGLKLILKGKNESDNLLQIVFESYLGYSNFDESYRLKTLNENELLTSQWPLFISKNDPLINWIAVESLGTISDIGIYTNYIFCTPNDIVEVISDEKPTIEWL